MPKRRPRAAKPGQAEPLPGDLQALFGQNLRIARVRQNKTQAELAEGAGLTPQYISKIEDGKINVTLDTMKKLATVLHSNVSEMIREAEHEAEQGSSPQSD